MLARLGPRLADTRASICCTALPRAARGSRAGITGRICRGCANHVCALPVDALASIRCTALRGGAKSRRTSRTAFVGGTNWVLACATDARRPIFTALTVA